MKTEVDMETDEEVKGMGKKIEEQLQHLRSPVAPGLSVTAVPVVQHKLKNLIKDIIPAINEGHDTTFLSDYLRVLRTGDKAAIMSVTNDVMETVADSLRQFAASELSEEDLDDRVVLCAFLSAATLADPPVDAARPALRQLLVYTTPAECVEVVRGWWRAQLPAAALVSLADSVRVLRAPGAPGSPPSLDQMLQRAALARVTPHAPGAPPAEPLWQRGAPALADLEAALAAWRQHGADGHDAVRLQLLGRALSAAPSSQRPALLRLAVAFTAPLPDEPPAARAARQVGVSKLEILFGEEVPVPAPAAKAKRPAARRARPARSPRRDGDASAGPSNATVPQ